MARALECVNALHRGHRRFKICYAVDGQHRAEFFSRKRIVLAGSRLFHQQHARLQSGHFQQARALRHHRRALADHRARELAIRPHQRLQARFLRSIEQHRTTGLQGLQQCGHCSVQHHQAVFRRATGGVVKRLRAQDALGGQGHVGAFIDDARHIARTHTKSRCAAGIGGAHIGLRASGHYQIASRHQRIGGRFANRRGQHLHQIARRADAIQRRVDVFQQACARGPAFGRGRDDDRIAAFKRVDDFVSWRGCRVG